MSILVPRETIYKALFDLMKGTEINGEPAFVYATRRMRTSSDVGSMQQPAFMMQQFAERITRMGSGLPKKQVMPVVFWLLFKPDALFTPVGDDNEIVPDTLINNYVDAFEDRLEPPTLRNAPGGKQTLGNLVEHARIEGVIEFDPGLTDNQAVIRIPVEILTTR